MMIYVASYSTSNAIFLQFYTIQRRARRKALPAFLVKRIELVSQGLLQCDTYSKCYFRWYVMAMGVWIQWNGMVEWTTRMALWNALSMEVPYAFWALAGLGRFGCLSTTPTQQHMCLDNRPWTLCLKTIASWPGRDKGILLKTSFS